MPVFETKRASVAVLIVTQIAVLSLWFSSAAVLPEMGHEAGLSAARLAWLSTAVQLGFGIGALGFAVIGLADRYDPRRVFMASALAGAATNLALLAVPIGGWESIFLRALTGAAMAGVYPVGMKIATGWGKTDRALLVGLLVGALTIGSASPHLISFVGGAEWRLTIWASTLLAAVGGLSIMSVGLGPYHARAPKLDISAIALTWTDRRIRLAVIGYIGHMWELYAFRGRRQRPRQAYRLRCHRVGWARLRAGGLVRRPHGPREGCNGLPDRQRRRGRGLGVAVWRPDLADDGGPDHLGHRHHPGLGSLFHPGRRRRATGARRLSADPANRAGFSADGNDGAGRSGPGGANRLGLGPGDHVAGPRVGDTGDAVAGAWLEQFPAK
jgi:hypothetical protein